MSKPLPLWANLVFGALFALIYTGTWAVVQDMEKLLPRIARHPRESQVATMLRKVKIRRAVSLLISIALAALYCLQVNMPIFGAVLLAVVWLDSWGLAGRARDLVLSFGDTGHLV